MKRMGIITPIGNLIQSMRCKSDQRKLVEILEHLYTEITELKVQVEKLTDESAQTGTSK